MTKYDKYLKLLVSTVIVVVILSILHSVVEYRSIPSIQREFNNQYEETIIVCADQDYEPFSFRDKNGNPQGYDIELIYLLAEEMEVNIDLRLIPWTMDLEDMDISEVDVMLGLEYTGTAAKEFDLSKPVQTSEYIAFGKNALDRASQLQTKKLGMLQGSIACDLFIEPNRLQDNTTYYATYEEGFQAVLDGEIDYLLGRYSVGKRVLKELGIKTIEPMGQVLASTTYCFGVSKNKPELSERLNKALRNIYNAGDVNNLTDKWLGYYVQVTSIKDYVMKYKENIILISVSALIVMIVWMSMRKERELHRQKEKEIDVERKKQEEIGALLKKHIAPTVAEYLLNYREDSEVVQNETRDIAVMFVDIRNFTSVSEQLEPKKIIDLLNEFFRMTTQSIFQHEGMVDKYIGDMIMAVFNSPIDLFEYNEKALRCALDIKSKTGEFEEYALQKYGVQVGAGIGLSCGSAAIGNIGTSTRVDFTAVGDVVNTASRLQACAESRQIFISEELAKRTESDFETGYIGLMELKGKSNKVNVYELLAEKKTNKIDIVTGLLNKQATKEAIRRELMQRNRGILFILYVENLKVIADNFGEAVEEDCVLAVVNILKTTFRISDIIGRSGDDEFVVFLTGASNEELAWGKATILRKDINGISNKHATEFLLTVRVGMAIAYPEVDFETLYNSAEDALTQAKDLGENEVCLAKKNKVEK